MADTFFVVESKISRLGRQVEFVNTAGVGEHGMLVELIFERGISYSPFQEGSIGEQV